MKKTTIEVDLGENRVSLKQNASGFWYVNDMTVNCTSIMDGISLMDKAIEKMNKILIKYNKKEKKENKIEKQ